MEMAKAFQDTLDRKKVPAKEFARAMIKADSKQQGTTSRCVV